MMGILPFAILLVFAGLVIFGWSIFRVVGSVRKRETIKITPFIGTLVGGAFLSIVWATIMALTVGLAHSRSISYVRTLIWSAPGTVILFIIPAVFLVCYQISIKERRKVS
ncbi:MAG TPA: hypothetical protein PKJ37_02000 [Acidobacteriota bacterium]|nr:hypothetical protein [Acidobacteriota bacterium]HNT16655.1 hypothetical protein [Acidobacteriota bacterium]